MQRTLGPSAVSALQHKCVRRSTSAGAQCVVLQLNFDDTGSSGNAYTGTPWRKLL
jgi:hypothetical protein